MSLPLIVAFLLVVILLIIGFYYGYHDDMKQYSIFTSTMNMNYSDIVIVTDSMNDGFETAISKSDIVKMEWDANLEVIIVTVKDRRN